MAVVNVAKTRDDVLDMVERVQDGERIVIISESCSAVLMSGKNTTA